MPPPARRHTAAHAALAPLRARLAERDDALMRAQVAVTEVAAPTGEEEKRAAWMRDRFTALGLANVRIDDAGNVIGRRPGRRDDEPVVVCAHLDTVFPRDTPLTVWRDGRRFSGPGIMDNGRGLAVMLALAEAIDGRAVTVERPIDFVGTTGEEGNGDLGGAKHYFAHAADRPSAVVAVDGAGDERIIHRALGTRRYRVAFQGPGGHSWAAFGAPNAIHAAAGATARLAAIPLSVSPRTTVSVGRIGGGISVNAIPDHAWIEIDVRSESPRLLDHMETEVRRAIGVAADEENARRARHTAALTASITRIGDRPGGETPADHPLVAAARAITQLSGRDPELAIASTDANVPIGLGIPAIAIGGGGRGGDAHCTTEWFENVDGVLGVGRALGIVLAASNLAG
ncbi:MAG TPA: M20/M25/M40 family metallo-hydrolase [Gemmatimonadaceae bacterium]|nr:M20/M25/M40 family metallo-hydrolase [Gemmatimonadaceae bacterium]